MPELRTRIEEIAEDFEMHWRLEQEVRRVSHQADPAMLEMIGRDIERIVFWPG